MKIPLLQIKKEFRDLIPPLSSYELSGLEEEIKYWGGCYSPIITWKGFIADGHHRYEICKKYGFSFKTEELNSPNERSVKKWMINNQFKRRNLPIHVRLDLAFEYEYLDFEEAKLRQEKTQFKKNVTVISPVTQPQSFFENPHSISSINYKKGNTIQSVAKRSECGYGTAFQYKKIRESGLTKKVYEGESIRKVYNDLRKKERASKLKVTLFPKDKYRILYADPPWDYGSSSTAKNTATPDKKYPVMSLEDICSMPIKSITDKDAVLFLWTTSYHIFQSQAVLDAWGFTYKSMFIWDKVKHNMGCYNSVRHEILLIATKGQCSPDNVELFDSVQSIERTLHSEKPEEFRRIIETLYKYGNKIELFARKKTEGWEAYGNEIG